MSKVKMIELAVIRENPDAIRAVNRKAEKYIGLVDSIKGKGFLGAITVREVSIDGTKCAIIVDGMHRYMASKDAGLTEIPCNIASFNEAEAIEASVMTNLHSIETTASEYRKGLLKLLNHNPMMTEGELAAKLGKSPSWISNILRLNNIESDEIMALIDGGEIKLSNAYALSKLPADAQGDFLTEAQTMTPEEFIPKINTRVKEIKDAKRKGEDPSKTVFAPAEFMQKVTAIRDERETGAIADSLIAEAGATTAKEGFVLALNWILHADAFSIQEQLTKWEQKEAIKAEKKQQKAAATAAKAKAKAEADLAKAAATEAALTA
ncbi:MAG: ParB/RepB/Spo0J family partition protein [Dehalococcoidia bacterium]|nr:MAG: ParB/RepB/Spo0J family partition protein [Dehalococcoidia bacterium]